MSYIYTRKHHHKRTFQLGGAAPNGNIPFPLMKKGERFIRCGIEMLGEREQRHVDKGAAQGDFIQGEKPQREIPFSIDVKGGEI